ncbi:MAG: 3-oxoacyl-ACP reductase FabG [Clostridia bacterium]|nr:3-oxoacyl-ACP reductase FabG [Clostridia bacterium]
MRVLITGGARGIGAACVEKFARNGHSVAFIYRSNHSAAKAVSKEYGALSICADISDPNEAKSAVSKVIEEMGGIDILINNAGISQIKMFCDITDEDVRSMLDTNLASAFYVTRAALPSMISQKWGRIINIGSMWGKVGASCEVHYSASKAGIRGMTMALAKELGPSSITVNAIEPGVIATDMNAELDENTMRELCNETPLCRIGDPMDVANLAYFLASYEASFITGQIIGVDGGFAV